MDVGGKVIPEPNVTVTPSSNGILFCWSSSNLVPFNSASVDCSGLSALGSGVPASSNQSVAVCGSALSDVDVDVDEGISKLIVCAVVSRFNKVTTTLPSVLLEL